MEPEEEQGRSADLGAWLETLRGVDLTDAEVEAAARQLLADRQQALPILLAQFADPAEDPALLAVSSVTLKAWVEPYPVKPLMALMRSPGVGALAKALIMTVLERYGVDIEGSGLYGVGLNLEEFEVDRGAGNPGVSPN